jgi:AcrR family transcriptional regulator
MPKPDASLDPQAELGTRTRDRAATQARLMAAVGDVLTRDGVSGIGINAVARAAGVDKVLIYRYWGGLPELLRAWGASGQFWPSAHEVMGDDPAAFAALPAAERLARFLEHFIDALRARPLTLAILAAEASQPNELTAVLEAEREAWGHEAARLLGGREYAAHPYLAGVVLVLVAGLQFLLLRARHTPVFSGIDLSTDAGWSQIKAALRALAHSELGRFAAPE